MPVQGDFVLQTKNYELFFDCEREMFNDPLVSTGSLLSIVLSERGREEEIQNEKNPLDMVASS
jgi:hypothetical protein